MALSHVWLSLVWMTMDIFEVCYSLLLASGHGRCKINNGGCQHEARDEHVFSACTVCDDTNAWSSWWIVLMLAYSLFICLISNWCCNLVSGKTKSFIFSGGYHGYLIFVDST